MPNPIDRLVVIFIVVAVVLITIIVTLSCVGFRNSEQVCSTSASCVVTTGEQP